MKSWQITAIKKLELIEGREILSEGLAKVRITRTALSDTDIMLYTQKQANYPVTPCRHAAGVISEIEKNDYELFKGDNVFLDPYVPCNDCLFCKNEDYCNCQNMQVYGVNRKGFLKDFAVVPLSSIKKLPDNVKIEDAVFVEYIAIALKVIDSVDIKKGEHVIIAGAGILGNIIAQLVLYYQAIPVVIDNDARNIEIVKNSDIYYTLLADNDIEKRITEITGGRLAKTIIYVSGSSVPPSLIFDFCRNGGTAAITGLQESQMTINLDTALKKQLTIICVKNGYGNIDSAINMLATKNIDLSPIVTNVYNFKDADKAFIETKNKNVYQAVINCISDE